MLGETYATLNDSPAVYHKIHSILNHEIQQNPDPDIKKVSKDAQNKIERYYDLQSPLAACAAILDPCKNF
ncbi:hypothetical protein HK096_008804, partial [Nowakowskiella sp. JEL0078]